jgi:hypothetical protein
MTLVNVFAQEPDGSLLHNAVWPDTTSALACPALYAGGLASWPGLPMISGGIRSDLPAGGDFVVAGLPGIN